MSAVLLSKANSARNDTQCWKATSGRSTVGEHTITEPPQCFSSSLATCFPTAGIASPAKRTSAGCVLDMSTAASKLSTFFTPKPFHCCI